MRKTIYAFHGPRGSGKTTLSGWLQSHFGEAVLVRIKDGFEKYSNFIIKDLESQNYNISLAAQKELKRRISTWAETEVDTNIWSAVMESRIDGEQPEVSIVEDARTTYNVIALNRLAVRGFNVVLFRLIAPEDVRLRRSETPSAANDYTERLLDKPADLHPRFSWHDIDTSGTQFESIQAMKAVIDEQG